MQTADEFLATGAKFQLGFLETEKPHPKTLELSELAHTNLKDAIATLAAIDCDALDVVTSRLPEIQVLKKEIENTWQSGHRVFLCGCGATGRLSLALECLHRERVTSLSGESAGDPAVKSPVAWADLVVSFMAGGDVALVHSIEGFEDFPEFGARQLRDLGFKDGDLLISCTEGGETPYVIGATEEAARISRRSPYFLYCNPDDVLCEHVERSRRVIEASAIKKINLTVGPMALAGSTRMQASTVLQLSVGLALLSAQLPEPANVGSKAKANTAQDFAAVAGRLIAELKKYLSRETVRFLPGFTEREASEYLASRYVMYAVNAYAITIFTDTTERAPTFSQTPFGHRYAEQLLKLKPSLCYIFLSEVKTPMQAWEKFLGRAPRPLNWNEIDQRTSLPYLRGFDFTELGARQFRQWQTNNAEHSEFRIGNNKNSLYWEFQDCQRGLILPKGLGDDADSALDSLFAHLLLKMLLNIHSTLIMGRLGRYKRNLMTWVYPTNGKLIDRAARYVRTLLHEDGIEISYEDTVRALFDVKKQITGNDSVVLATYNYLKTKRA